MLIQLYSLGFMIHIFFYHMLQLWLFSNINMWLHCFQIIW